MPQATELPLSPSGQSSYHPQPTPNYQDEAGTPAPRKTPLQQPDKDKVVPHHIPRLRAVVESKTFKNILVDEVDMMQSRAATLIQANWRGHQLRRKLVSQMLAAKGVQAAWRRFSTRRLRSGKATEKKTSVDEGNIPYHTPQQVRFRPSKEDGHLLAPPVMVNKETQFPSDDSLAACAHQLALLQPPGVPRPGMQAPCATGGPSVTFLPHQTVSVRLPCPVSLNAKYHPCLLTRTIRSTSLIHLEGDTTKTKQVTTKASKAGTLGSPCERIAQTLHSPLKTQTQAHVEAEVLRAPPQTCQPSVMTKTPLQSCLASTMNKSIPEPCPTPTAIIAKTPSQLDSVVPVAKTTLQSCLAAILNKIPTQPCQVPTMIMTTPPQPCLAAPMTKTPAQMRPTALMTSTAPRTQPPALTSIVKPRTQTCPGPVMAKPLLQTRPVATTAKTPSQTLLGASTTKTPTQTRLAAMITKTPAQLRSVATVLRNLCLPPPADGNLKASPPAVVADGILNTSSHTNLNRPKAKAVVTGRQMAGTATASSHSHLTEGRVKYCPPPHLGAGAPKAPARPFLEAEKTKAFSQKQVKMATMSNTSVATDRSKVLSQARPKTDAMKVPSQVCVPVEMAVVLPQAHLGTCLAKPLPRAQKAACSTTASPHRHMLAKQTRALSQANIVRCLSKPPSQAHPPAKLTTDPCLAHPGMCLTEAQSQAHLPTETAKCLYAAHQAAELSSKMQPQPLLAGFKASAQPYQHVGSLGTLSRAKPEDRLTQLPAHSCAQGKAAKSSRQGASKTPSMLVPLLVSTGPSACNFESWGDSRATLAQPSTTSPAAPCQEELGVSQLASLCAELATMLGSQEDIRALLVKALPQGEVRAALNQALSKEILGTTMAKTLPQGMLGTAPVKGLSWSELGTALSCALSQGELQAELTKAIQGKLVDVLSKVLTERDRATLSQAVCQGELGTILSQSLSQAALQTGLVPPKATSKTLGSGMMVTPVPVEVDSRESRSTAWGPTTGRVRPQPSKVRVPQGGAWEGFVTGGPAGLLEELGDGAIVRRSPCLSRVYVGASLVTRLITTIFQFPLITVLDPILSWNKGDSSVHPGVGKWASDLHSG